MLNKKLDERKKELFKMLDDLNEKYPENDIYSLDYWDKKGFQKN